MPNQPLERVTQLSPLVLFNKDFPFRKFVSAEGYTYYAKIDKLPKEPSLKKYDTIDGNFRVLSYVLHAHNAETYVCRECKYKDKEMIKKDWNIIKRDEKQIRRNGIQVVDVQTGSKYLFQNYEYQLPWNTYDNFANYSNNDKTSYIVIEAIADKANQIISYKTPSTKTAKINDILWIESTNENQILQEEEWRLATQHIAAIVMDKTDQKVVQS